MKIDASKCSKCKRAVVPPRQNCPYCGPSADSVDLIDLPNKGVVLSYTVHHVPPDGFDTPLLLALVKLDYDAVVLCSGDIADASRISIDQDVSLLRDESGKYQFTLNN